jgi:hypothetical protein
MLLRRGRIDAPLCVCDLCKRRPRYLAHGRRRKICCMVLRIVVSRHFIVPPNRVAEPGCEEGITMVEDLIGQPLVENRQLLCNIVGRVPFVGLDELIQFLQNCKECAVRLVCTCVSTRPAIIGQSSTHLYTVGWIAWARSSFSWAWSSFSWARSCICILTVICARWTTSTPGSAPSLKLPRWP